MATIVAVLTGDLIGSTAAGSEATDRTMKILSSTQGHISKLAGESTRFTRYRGDGWQSFLYSPQFALEASLLITAVLRGTAGCLMTRISVGLGTLDRLGATSLETASGQAFVESGMGLDKMPRSKHFAINGAPYVRDWHRAIFDLVEWQSGRWSREQAEAVALTLMHNWPQEDLAKLIGVSRQALNARLRSAGRSALDEALHAFSQFTFDATGQP